MQKTKLIELILRNLEELKEISGEIIAGSEIDHKEIDLAIGITKTLQIELEILKGKTNKPQLNKESKENGSIELTIAEQGQYDEEQQQNDQKNPHQEIESANNFLDKKQIYEIIEEIKNNDRNTSIPLTSLKNAIGLNDRYYFAKELFENNMNHFISVIETIDKLDNLEQATNYLESIRLINNESSHHFIELVKRRF